jgi:hypothetical protein
MTTSQHRRRGASPPASFRWLSPRPTRNGAARSLRTAAPGVWRWRAGRRTPSTTLPHPRAIPASSLASFPGLRRDTTHSACKVPNPVRKAPGFARKGLSPCAQDPAPCGQGFLCCAQGFLPCTQGPTPLRARLFALRFGVLPLRSARRPLRATFRTLRTTQQGLESTWIRRRSVRRDADMGQCHETPRRASLKSAFRKPEATGQHA